MPKDKIEKIILAYSGGLDTTCCVPWLKEKYNAEVIAFCADLGQDENFDLLKEKALKSGASKVIIKDLQEEFIKDFIFPALKANAVYEGKYLLATALSRPIIAKHLVEAAQEENAQAVAHGSTGKGNDQVRFEVTVMALNPHLKNLAPVREWEFKTREEEIDYAKKYNLSLPVTKDKPYSIDKNLWGVSIECGILEDPWLEPPEDVYLLTKSPKDAPDKEVYLEIDFEKGIPLKINGQKMTSAGLIEVLNKIGGENGVGRSDMVEDRLVGIKSREIYECPAGTILYIAHQEIESLTLDRETLQYKEEISLKYSQLIYYGLWYSPLRQNLADFVEATQENVTGTVRIKLYKGNCQVVGRKSPFSLYDKSLATYEKGDLFDQKLAKGFVELWGLPLKVKAMIEKNKTSSPLMGED